MVQHEFWYELFQENCIKGGDRKKTNPIWGLFKEFNNNKLWFYCTVCYAREPKLISQKNKQLPGILKYDKSNTTLFKNHCSTKHMMSLSRFTTYIDERKRAHENKHEKEQPLVKKSKKSISDAISIEVMNRFIINNKRCGKDSKRSKSL